MEKVRIAGRMRKLVGAVYLLLQVGSLIYGRLAPSRFFTWAVFEDVTQYNIHVTIGERLLTPAEISERYHIDAAGVYENPTQDIVYIVRQYEETYGREDHSRVVLTYCADGNRTIEWKWPTP
jgi:hypothetical protein